MANKRLKQFKSDARRIRADKQWRDILGRHSELRKTSRRGLSGRDPNTIRYNTALRVLQGQDPEGLYRGRSLRMGAHPGLKGAQKCMKKAMMKGASMRDAYTGCGLQDTDSYWEGKKVMATNPETGLPYAKPTFVPQKTTMSKEQWDALKHKEGSWSFSGVEGLDQFAGPQRRSRRRRY